VRERLAERVYRARHGTERTLVRELEHFAAMVRGESTPAASGWDGCWTTEMIDAVYRADESGKECTLGTPSHATPSVRLRSTRERAA
jgi:hypothetical protein